MARPLTEKEEEIFNAIREASNIALMQTKIDGEEGAVIVAITGKGEDDLFITPLAVLVTDEAMIDRIMDPQEA